MKNIVLIIYLLFGLTPKIYSQQVQVTLTKKFGNNFASSYSKPTSVVKDISNYNGLDTSNAISWEVREFILFVQQEMKERVVKGIMPSDKFEKYADFYKVDTSHVIPKIIKKNKVSTLVKSDKNFIKYITVDSNNNFDFSDDSTYIFKPNDKEKFPIVPILFEYYNGKEVLTTIVKLAINIYNVDENKLDFAFLNQAYNEGILKQNNEKFIIQIDDEFYGLYSSKKYKINVRKVPIDSSVNNNYVYSNEELIEIGNKLYNVDSLVNNYLYLTFHKLVENSGGRINSFAPEISSFDIVTNMPFSLSNTRGKYILLDFWGTWCAPCIESIPELRSLHEKYNSQKIDFVSIAFERGKEKNKLFSLIKEKKMNWKHLMFDLNDLEGVLKLYKIQAFPTTILIDPNGMVKVRGESSLILKTIDSYLKKTFLE